LLYASALMACMAAGVDIDREALAWGAQHNGDALLGGSATEQLCLLHSNVSSPCLRTLLVLHHTDSIVQHIRETSRSSSEISNHDVDR
jgi:hypothetical protein